MANSVKRFYWRSRERARAWRDERVRNARLRAEAYLHPVFEIHGVRLSRSWRYTPPILTALASGEYEAPEARIVGSALEPADRVLELGTGLGLLSTLCARTIGSDRVDSFEANPALRPVILKNYSLNGVSPRLHTTLLSDRDGEIRFYVMKDFWSSSTVRRHPRAHEIVVPTRSFNDELDRIRPTFLIIDIEGGELDWIRHARVDGVSKVCIELHPHVIGEAGAKCVESFFEANGFVADAVLSTPRQKFYTRARSDVNRPGF